MFAGVVLVAAISAIVAFRGFPGLREASSTQSVSLPEAGAKDAQRTQRVYLGGRHAAAKPAPAAAAHVPHAARARLRNHAKPGAVGHTGRTHSVAPHAASAPAAQPAQPPAAAEPPAAKPGVVDSVVKTADDLVDSIAPPPDRDGLAGAADDVVQTLDQILP